MKTIIIAYACSPDQGSEEGVGFNYVSAISRFSECFVITVTENKKKLLKSNLNNVQWIFVDEDIIKKKFFKIWNVIGSSVMRFLIAYSYGRWQKKAEKKIEQLIKTNEIDLVHKITYVGYRFPIYFKNIPVINGPLGGIENMPLSYFHFMSLKGKLIFFIRNILNQYQRTFSMSLKKKYSKNNNYIISAHSKIAQLMKKYYKKNSLILSEICHTNNLINPIKKNKIITVIWVGDIEPGKNLLPLLISKKNMQKMGVEFNLIVCGSGSELNNLKKFTDLNRIKNVEFKGKITRLKTLQLMQMANIYVTTSLKDLTSTSLVEAMCCNCAIITTPLSGFKDAIGKSKSLYLDLSSKKNFVNSITNSLLLYINNKTIREEYSNSTFQESKKFNHENVSSILENYYKTILNNK